MTYGSQAVFEVLEGKARVWEYLAGKIDTLRSKRDRRPRCELGTDSSNKPCVLMFQPQGPYDRAWLDTPLASVECSADENGLATSIFMITSVPPPSLATRSGLYPGVREAVHERARRFIRPGAEYHGLRFALFLLDGNISLDRMMLEEAETVLAAFPGASRSVFLTSKQTSERDELDELNFAGFPSVAVFWQDEVVYKHEGFIPAQNLIDVVRDMTTLHVISETATNTVR